MEALTASRRLRIPRLARFSERIWEGDGQAPA